MFAIFRKKKIETTKIVDEIESIVFEWIKQFGFKKYGRTLNRIVDKDIVQVINFQNGCPEKRVYGVLWINLGIRVPECAYFPNEQKKYYKEYECNIRCRLDEYIDNRDNPYDLKENPATKAGPIGEKEAGEIVFWTKEEYLKFAETLMHKPKSYYAFEILYWCGIRLGELLALTPEDFDFEKGTLRINKSYQRIDKRDVITPPKTKKSNRIIKMPEFLCEEVKE